MPIIPDQVRREVIAELYERFDEIGWEERTLAERSAIYQRLVDDPAIGGRLEPHIPLDRVRLWIKDGPAKEYRRALEGVGPYARFTKRRAVGPPGVVDAVLGADWAVVGGSVGEKPMRCHVELGDARRLVIWGPEPSLKELFWHAAVHLLTDTDDEDPLIVITKRGNAPLDATLWRRAKALGELIGCDVAQVSLAVTEKLEEE